MNHYLLLSLLLASAASAAETPHQTLDLYTTEAARRIPGFEPNAGLGEVFFQRRFAKAPNTPSCVSCHSDNPVKHGRHAATGHRIGPLAPASGNERLTDPAMVEKWLARDCQRVIGRECTAGEKADLLSYLISPD
ncbi:MAG: DUF1924 domain-containing protein [Gammaproteobacteria bacterium]|nr:DUF1924 domain-containing protein [Gammaproteobacteria bacterium]MBU1414718.1 DUF1924 domain-containing protein [Gammaproteobacteria bacterium]